VTRFQNKPVLGYMLKYEATIPMYRRSQKQLKRLDNRQELKIINTLVKKEAPHTLTTVQIDDRRMINKYAGLTDVLEVAFWSSSYANRLMANLERDLQELKQNIPAHKCFFFWIGSSVPHDYWRTAAQIRGAAYLAAMYGAAGLVFHMGHGGISTKYTRHLSVYQGLSHELSLLYPVLAAPRAPVQHCQIKQSGFVKREFIFKNKLYLVVLNMTPGFNTVKATLKSNLSLSKITVWGENRQVSLKKQTFQDSFSAYEPHIYQVSLKNE
jgi:hypothetical protein